MYHESQVVVDGFTYESIFHSFFFHCAKDAVRYRAKTKNDQKSLLKENLFYTQYVKDAHNMVRRGPFRLKDGMLRQAIAEDEFRVTTVKSGTPEQSKVAIDTQRNRPFERVGNDLDCSGVEIEAVLP